MHSEGKAADSGGSVKRNREPFVAEYYSEQLVHSYFFQVRLQPARHADPGCIFWEGLSDTVIQTGCIDAIRFPSQ